MNKEIKKLADVISFRLLATRKHPDYNWLEETLKKFKEEEPKKEKTIFEKIKSFFKNKI